MQMVKIYQDSEIRMMNPLGYEWKELDPKRIVQVATFEGQYGALVVIEYGAKQYD